MRNGKDYDPVLWVNSSQNNDELSERYNSWSTTYDDDLSQDFEWIGPNIASDIFEKYVPKASQILDAGAGTGLVGHLLKGKGYLNLTAMDISQGMLSQAAEKNIYKELHEMVMGQPLSFATNRFNATISIGVMTVGHAPPESLDELIRVTSPQGHIVFTLRTDVYKSYGFQEKMDSLISSSHWSLLEEGEPFHGLAKGAPEIQHQVWVFRVS
ncbi:MAG: class I SAM-dependent methyltransferase [Chloroflexota bacterium]|nr:class I SAM-dependent methyltransferase [Chloroflexota bacterium]